MFSCVGRINHLNHIQTTDSTGNTLPSKFPFIVSEFGNTFREQEKTERKMLCDGVDHRTSDDTQFYIEHVFQ